MNSVAPISMTETPASFWKWATCSDMILTLEDTATTASARRNAGIEASIEPSFAAAATRSPRVARFKALNRPGSPKPAHHSRQHSRFLERTAARRPAACAGNKPVVERYKFDTRHPPEKSPSLVAPNTLQS